MSIMEAIDSEDYRRAVAEAREYVRRNGGTGSVSTIFDMKDDRYQGFRVLVNLKPFYGQHSHVLAPPSTRAAWSPPGPTPDGS